MSDPIVYNARYYDGINLKQLSPSLTAFKTYRMKDGTIIGLFQGERGANPKIDFVLKALFPGAYRKSSPPKHTFWVVDLLLKIREHRTDVREIVQYYIDFYQKCSPFLSVQERNFYELQTVDYIASRDAHIEQDNTPSIDYVATIVELFCKNEKLTPGAYMYRDMLVALRDYIDGKCHYTDVLQAAQPGYK